MELDTTDRKILNILQTDGRMTNADLAQRVNLSASACLRRVQILEAEGIIQGYSMLLNPKAVARDTEVFVDVSLQSQSHELLDRFEEAIGNCPDVLECHLMSGDADYLLRVAVRDSDDYERIHREYLSRLPGISRLRSNFALRTVFKRKGFPL